MVHDARSVANELIRHAHKAGRDITHLQVQKLVYFCEAWMLGIYGKSMIRQDVQAWKYGPVVEDVYYNLRGNGRNPITSTIEKVESEQFGAEEENIISQVHDIYGALSGIQLSALTHDDGTPWDMVWDRWGVNSSIPKSLIRDYYRRKYEGSIEKK